MRAILFGLAALIGVVALGFGTLVLIANGMEPTQEEVRVEVEDDFPR